MCSCLLGTSDGQIRRCIDVHLVNLNSADDDCAFFSFMNEVLHKANEVQFHFLVQIMYFWTAAFTEARGVG